MILSSLRVVLAGAAFSAVLSSCSLIDDFSDFRIVHGDGGDDDSGVIDGSDAAIPLCGGEDCTALNGLCTQGKCQDQRCVAVPIREGLQCGDDKCTVCGNGECNAPKNCSAYDGPCTKGVCNAADGVCAASNINEGNACFDNDPCTVSESCMAGVCKGSPRDCSSYDDQCSSGVCEKDTGNCTYGTPNSSRTCDDYDPCTVNDSCDATGQCIASGSAPFGERCDDFNACTGTNATPDYCDGKGVCKSGTALPAGTACNDDNECTSPDTCSAGGACTGPAVREGQACQTGCKTGNTCKRGSCLNADGVSLGYKPECYFNWCGEESLCQARWQEDGACDCGCGFTDTQCNACSARMCEALSKLSHRAAKWCDAEGRAIQLCPDSLKDDGKCDCGCQFADPDCDGGSCCGPTGGPGCDNAFIEDCVCEREGRSDAAPSCCKQEWTQQCADLAVELGCMICGA